MQVTIVNLVIIDGEEVEIETLPNKEELVDKLNTKALNLKNYYVEDKTA